MSQIRQAFRLLAVVVICTVSVQAQLPERDFSGRQVSTKRGAEVFANTCTGFCHGEQGAAGGGAPRLAGRGLDPGYIQKVVTYGIAGTAMPGFGEKLTQVDLLNVIWYVTGLNGSAKPPNAASAVILEGEALRGSELFFNYPEELARCSQCHRVGEKGTAVAPPIMNVPDLAGLHNVAISHVVSVSADGQTFPGLVVSERRNATKVYDITTVPPVLRTFAPSAVKIQPKSNWQHASVLSGYSNTDLEQILAFLRAAGGH
jgi:mono/diheme cytochrome c family protein